MMNKTPRSIPQFNSDTPYKLVSRRSVSPLYRIVVLNSAIDAKNASLERNKS